ncbi:XRE family transcriptional regulator [Streptomyces ipomoeae]|uniref:XRE family transcriptional regulator n=1 Tax=Streptomyces ipomoeae TaxID=103232 RepID=UPI0015F0EE7D|nr:XRE family transcriptional regulator [Streptomyces ipomoeae]
MHDDRPAWAQRMEAERMARGWSPLDAARAMQAHSPTPLPDDRNLARQWRRWETGETEPRDHKELIAKVFGTTTHAFFPIAHRRDGRAEIQAASGMDTVDIVARLRISDVDQATLDAVAITVDRLCSEYGYMPSDQLLTEGRAWLTRLGGLQQQRMTLAQHREVLVQAGMLTLLVGCVEYDSGGPKMRRAAEGTRQAALALGREAGHPLIVGWGHEMRAWFALTRGDLRGVIAAADDGIEAAPTETVAVQLWAQKAKAWARIGDRRQVEVALDSGRRLLESMGYPENPENHFTVDPAKWDFYAMDCYRKLAEDRLAETLAREVLRTGVDYDGTDRAPMRNAEARVTLGVVAARQGALDEAVSYGMKALGGERQSLPSLAMVADDLGGLLSKEHANVPEAQEFLGHLQTLRSA